MYAAINRNDRSLVAATGFDHKGTANGREFLFSGVLEGVVENDYTVNPGVSLEDLVAQLPKLATRLSGACLGVSTYEDRFEFAVGDLNCAVDLYFGVVGEELILSDDFFDVAGAMGTLEYRKDELDYFVKHRYCRAGQTFFRGVYRLAPGTMLFLDADGTTSLKPCLDDFQGVKLEYETFKRAFRSTLQSIVDSDAGMNDVVLLSGGVDSSLLLAALQQITNVSTLTLRSEPPFDYYEADGVRSRRITSKLSVPNDFVVVDYYDEDIDRLLPLVASMPFGAQLSTPFLLAFGTLRKGNVRAWSGLNCDSLYNLGASYRRGFVQRFLVSEAYLQMQDGVKNHERYRLIKKIADKLICRHMANALGITAQAPQTFEQLSYFFFNSDDHLALNTDADAFFTKEIQTPRTEDALSAKEAYRTLYDEMLGAYCTGGDIKALHCCGNLNGIQVALPYTKANMVHLFRSNVLSWMDILFAKRYVYKFARELGLSKHTFIVKPSDLGRGLSEKAWEHAIINDTAFGDELASRAKAAADSMAWHSYSVDLETLVGMAWLGRLRTLLEQRGVDIRGYDLNSRIKRSI
ncbi:MAG: asparagine synthase-related protein [Halobacteriota archaeon]